MRSLTLPLPACLCAQPPEAAPEEGDDGSNFLLTVGTHRLPTSLRLSPLLC